MKNIKKTIAPIALLSATLLFGGYAIAVPGGSTQLPHGKKFEIKRGDIVLASNLEQLKLKDPKTIEIPPCKTLKQCKKK